MKHKNYFEIKADSYYDLGLKEGKLFEKDIKRMLVKEKKSKLWAKKVKLSKKYLVFSEKYFPQYIEELKGYALGAKISFEDLWVLILEDELTYLEKCSTIITNKGNLIAHNEDWTVESKNNICLLKKTVKNLTVFELFYYNIPGGNSISINSNGIIQAINTLNPADKRIGIPKNIIARWMSETKDPVKDFEKLKKLPRSAGYNHNFINLKGKVWNIETTAKKQKLSLINHPFVHTNHYLTHLKEFEKSDNSTWTFHRHGIASSRIREKMSLNEMKRLVSDDSGGKKLSLLNERTIARMIVDLENKKIYAWLLREKEKGWVTYSLKDIV